MNETEYLPQLSRKDKQNVNILFVSRHITVVSIRTEREAPIMKSKLKLLALLAMMALFLMLPLTAMAGGFESSPPKYSYPVGLERTKLTLYVGNQYQLRVFGTTKKVTWKSSKKSVATVSSTGLVKAKKKGTATISAKVNKKTYKCKLTVLKVPAAPAPYYYGYDYKYPSSPSTTKSYSPSTTYPSTTKGYVVQAGVFYNQSNLAKQFMIVKNYVPDAYWIYKNGAYTIVAGYYYYRENAVKRYNFLMNNGISACIEYR